MILARLRREALARLGPLSGWDARGAPLAPAPAHVPADVSFPWPMQAAKALRAKPMDLARGFARELAGLAEIAEASEAPPGFTNVRLSARALADNLRSLLADVPAYCAAPEPSSETFLIEFVSANPTGPVHLASGRAATLGDGLARILRARGHRVATEYYVNDAGRQVRLLGLSVKARYEERLGHEAALPEGGYAGEYIRELAAQVPSEAERWGPEDFSRYAVERMLFEHRRDMESFGVRFDAWFRESSLHAAKALEETLAQLKVRGKTYEKDGALWLGSSGEEEAQDDKDRVLVRSDGGPTYFLADIAYHRDKLRRGFTRLIDIWGADHHGYVPRMRAALLALGASPDAFRPVVHQLVHLYRGKVAVKMSKRAGEFITLSELLAEAGRDACRFFFALRGPNAHMNFDVELARKQSQENPVYYVQYVHARACSIFREAESRGLKAAPDLAERLEHPCERALLVKLAWLPEALAACERELSPHPLATYLMESAGLFHPFYENCRVVDELNPELSSARLALCAGVRSAIAQGLELLGVSAPKEM